MHSLLVDQTTSAARTTSKIPPHPTTYSTHTRVLTTGPTPAMMSHTRQHLNTRPKFAASTDANQRRSGPTSTAVTHNRHPQPLPSVP